MQVQSKVLVVDDREIMRKTVVRILQPAGYEIREAASGAACLQLVKDFQPDLILLDMDMPGLSGSEVCRLIKADPHLRSTFIVHLSASKVTSEDQTRGLEDGADGYISWPIKGAELQARVQAMLRIKQTEKALAEQQKWFRVTLASLADGVIATDIQGLVTLLNPVAQNLTGWTQEEAQGKPWHQVLQLLDAANGHALVAPGASVLSLSAEATQFEQVLMASKAGLSIPVSGSSSPIRDEQGKFLGAVFVFRDISVKMRQEAERERLIKELQEALSSIKVLRGLLPICSGCKKIRDDKGYWNQLEIYIAQKSEAQFTHGLCPDCIKKFYSDWA